MAKRNHMIMSQLGYCMTFLIVIAYVIGDQYVVVARKTASLKNKELVKHKGTVKTIKSEDGDVIDCVDIYKQPAFDHPLLKNHTIEMKPSFYPKGLEPKNSQTKILQSWQRNGECPEGTVPIRRTHQRDYRRVIPFTRHTKKLNQSILRDFPGHEYAQVSQSGDDYYGAYAKINVWNPKTEISQEFSLSQIWLLSGNEGARNTIEAGWIVYPSYYHDNRTRFFTYWTRDNYQTTGCYNLDCPGFVQISRSFYLGGPINRVSGYGKNQYDMATTIYKNTESGNWWLMIQDNVMGYWPGTIFTSLHTASNVNWGGEVINIKSMGHHTSTQMGSGHFPYEGFGKSSFFSNLGVMDKFLKVRNAERLDPYVSSSKCYDIKVKENSRTESGTYFYYGGPGYSDRCP